MKRRTTVEVDADLLDSAKRIGGHGIVKELTVAALRAFVQDTPVPDHLPSECRDQIRATRKRCDRAKGRRKIIRDCYNAYLKVKAKSVILKRGLTKKVIDFVLPDVKEWMYDLYDRLPPDDEIKAVLQECYENDRDYWDAQRADVYRQERLDHQFSADGIPLASGSTAGLTMDCQPPTMDAPDASVVAPTTEHEST